MRYIYFFWYHLNWLEFVTYVLIPTAMVLMVLVYILSNIKLLKISLENDNEIFNKLDKVIITSFTDTKK